MCLSKSETFENFICVLFLIDEYFTRSTVASDLPSEKKTYFAEIGLITCRNTEQLQLRRMKETNGVIYSMVRT